MVAFIQSFKNPKLVTSISAIPAVVKSMRMMDKLISVIQSQATTPNIFVHHFLYFEHHCLFYVNYFNLFSYLPGYKVRNKGLM